VFSKRNTRQTPIKLNMKPELSNSTLMELETMMEELKQHESHGVDRFIWLSNVIAHAAKQKMKGQNLQLKDLAQIMGKKPAEVSRMLNGMHNMTLKSIASLETALGSFLLNVEGFENEYLLLEELDNIDSFKQDTSEGLRLEFADANNPKTKADNNTYALAA